MPGHEQPDLVVTVSDGSDVAQMTIPGDLLELLKVELNATQARDWLHHLVEHDLSKKFTENAAGILEEQLDTIQDLD